MFTIINDTITISQGDSASFGLIITDPNEEDKIYELQPGDRVILSVKPVKKDADYLFQIEGPDFEILPHHTKNANPDFKYKYDVELRFADGIHFHTIITSSPFIIKKEVTDDEPEDDSQSQSETIT